MLQDDALLDNPLGHLLTAPEVMQILGLSGRVQLTGPDSNRKGVEFSLRFAYVGDYVQVFDLDEVRFAAAIIDARELTVLPAPYDTHARKEQVDLLRRASKISIPLEKVGIEEVSTSGFVELIERLVTAVPKEDRESYCFFRLSVVMQSRKGFDGIQFPAKQFKTVTQYAELNAVSRQTAYSRLDALGPKVVEFGNLKLVPM